MRDQTLNYKFRFQKILNENVDKPFLDILNSLEKLEILDVDEWFELREIRNEIADNYEENETTGRAIINSLYNSKNELQSILKMINCNTGGQKLIEYN